MLGRVSDNSASKRKQDKYGKEKCKKLKQIRKLIAEVNDIPFETIECHHQGACPGTCPACDAEIKYLDEQLQQKIRRGEKVTLSGLAVDMIDSPRRRNDIAEDIADDDVAVDGRSTLEDYGTLGQDEDYPLDDEDDDEEPEERVMVRVKL